MAENDEVRPPRRPFFFRFPDDLRERLAVEAEAAERTLTAEIVYRLRKSLRPATARSPDQKIGPAFAREPDSRSTE